VLGPNAGAHHAIGRANDSTRQLGIEGVVTEFRFIKPHPFLVIDVVTAGGEIESWQLELDNRVELSRVSMSESTFEAGDRVIASGSANRTEARTV
jgi:hypothetical protein